MTEEHADETMVASMRADAERQGADDRKVTDAPHYLARVLMANGIRNMYGVVGIPVTDFARIAQGMGMRFVGMRHEEDAVNAAAADGFITGRPAVTLTVSAPGFLNGLPALLEATVNGYPVIMIGGSSTRHVVDLEEGEYEGLDQMNYAKQFCKASLRIDRIEDIPLAVARAMHIASSGRPGAVYIDFPDDTVAQTLSQSEADRLMCTATDPAPAMVPARESIDAALALLQQAERPLMVIGKGAAIARAEEEIREAKGRMETVEHDLEIALLPKDPNDEKNLFLEIRAGTGGDESALFAGDLLRMYLRYAENRGWKTEIVSENPSDLGGYREVIVRIIGRAAYSALKFESGVHRVQRVPVTESQGRIHTSAATVAVLPELDAVEVADLSPKDLRIDVFRASGAGGQHVQKTDSAVRITHLPTGLTVECQDERSQTQNKARAMAVLAARLYAMREAEQKAKEASERKSLVGSGDRSERIRTYNFPQGRVTDHRINLTLYRLDAVLDGDLDELISALTMEHQASLLASSL